jgi:hypothetical protein
MPASLLNEAFDFSTRLLLLKLLLVGGSKRRVNMVPLTTKYRTYLIGHSKYIGRRANDFVVEWMKEDDVLRKMAEIG